MVNLKSLLVSAAFSPLKSNSFNQPNHLQNIDTKTSATTHLPKILNPIPKVKHGVHNAVDLCTYKIEDMAVDNMLKQKFAQKIPEAIEPWAKGRLHEGLCMIILISSVFLRIAGHEEAASIHGRGLANILKKLVSRSNKRDTILDKYHPQKT